MPVLTVISTHCMLYGSLSPNCHRIHHAPFSQSSICFRCGTGTSRSMPVDAFPDHSNDAPAAAPRASRASPTSPSRAASSTPSPTGAPSPIPSSQHHLPLNLVSPIVRLAPTWRPIVTGPLPPPPFAPQLRRGVAAAAGGVPPGSLHRKGTPHPGRGTGARSAAVDTHNVFIFLAFSRHGSC